MYVDDALQGIVATSSSRLYFLTRRGQTKTFMKASVADRIQGVIPYSQATNKSVAAHTYNTNPYITSRELRSAIVASTDDLTLEELNAELPKKPITRPVILLSRMPTYTIRGPIQPRSQRYA